MDKTDKTKPGSPGRVSAEFSMNEKKKFKNFTKKFSKNLIKNENKTMTQFLEVPTLLYKI